MTKISSLVELLGAGVDLTNDLLTIVDMSETGAARNKKIKINQLLGLVTDIAGMLDFQGTTDCSANPNYPAASQGDFYVVSVAGKIGGASGVTVTVGDAFFAIADNAGGTQAGVGSSWSVLQANIVGSTGIDVQDEGTPEASGAGTLNFVGSGVVATDMGGGIVEVNIPGGGANALDDLTDVDVPTPADGDILTWVDADNEWQSQPGSHSGFRGALVKKSADQTGANFTTLTAVTWDSETGGYDTDSIHDNSTNPSRMTVPSGVTRVRLFGNIRIDNKTTADWVHLIAHKNGSFVIGLPNIFFEPGAAQVQWNFVSAPIEVTPGDYLEMKLQVESDTTIDINSTFSWFAMEIIEALPTLLSSTAARGAAVTKAADQTTADYDPATTVTFDSELYDTDNIHDNVTNNSRLTVPAGVTKVKISYNVLLSDVTTNTSVEVQVLKNGSGSYSGNPATGDSNVSTSPRFGGASPVLTVTPGDYFQLELGVVGDASITVAAGYTWFAMEVVEAPTSSTVFSGALVKKAADQTTADYSAFPLMTFDAEEYDTDSYHDNSTNPGRLTVPSAGYYRVGAEVAVGSGTLTTSEYIRLSITRRNAAGTAQSRIGLPNTCLSEISASPTLGVLATSMPVLCNAGDYFELNFDTEADTSITIQADSTWFGIERVG